MDRLDPGARLQVEATDTWNEATMAKARTAWDAMLEAMERA